VPKNQTELREQRKGIYAISLTVRDDTPKARQRSVTKAFISFGERASPEVKLRDGCEGVIE
jgi:hypothetical protein